VKLADCAGQKRAREAKDAWDIAIRIVIHVLLRMLLASAICTFQKKLSEVRLPEIDLEVLNKKKRCVQISQMCNINFDFGLCDMAVIANFTLKLLTSFT